MRFKYGNKGIRSILVQLSIVGLSTTLPTLGYGKCLDQKLDPDEVAKVQKMEPPPYDLDLSTIVELVYPVATKQIQKFLPETYRSVSFFGHSFLTVLIANYTAARSSKEQGKPYQEISYLTQVVHEGSSGNYFLKLHLNSRDGWILGRTLYGYPKDLARIGIKDNLSSLQINANCWDTDEELLAMDLEKESGLKKIDGIFQGLISQVAWLVFGDGLTFLQRDSQPTMAQATFNVNLGSAQGVKVKNIRLPYAIEEGLLEPQQVSRPLEAIYFNGANLALGKPLVEQLD